MKSYPTLNKRIRLLLIFPFCFSVLLAQEVKTVQVKGKSQVQWYPERESLTQAREHALELAKIDALETAFGTLVIQGNSIYIENKKTGEKVETNTTYKMIGNTAVKGEIIRVINTDYKETVRKEKVNRKKVEITYISCNVLLEAKEISDIKIDIKSFPLSSDKLIVPNTQFYVGDDLFVYFKSPLNGYLTIYLDDLHEAQCLLPYRKMPKGLEEAMPIIADKEYLFFSDKPQHNYFDDDFFAEDTYELVASSEKDMNELYIIFSKQPLNKLLLDDPNHPVQSGDNQYILPRAVKSDEFKQWLLKIQQTRNDIQVIKEIISIEKRK